MDCVVSINNIVHSTAAAYLDTLYILSILSENKLFISKSRSLKVSIYIDIFLVEVFRVPISTSSTKLKSREWSRHAFDIGGITTACISSPLLLFYAMNISLMLAISCCVFRAVSFWLWVQVWFCS